MHRSRLTSIVIDCAAADFQRGVEFWSAALGRAPVPRVHGNDRFAAVKGRFGGEGGLYVGLQRVPHTERAIHLDIETDDVEAEVGRLERLGARIKARIRQHVVMEPRPVMPSVWCRCSGPTFRPGPPSGRESFGDEVAAGQFLLCQFASAIRLRVASARRVAARSGAGGDCAGRKCREVLRSRLQYL